MRIEFDALRESIMLSSAPKRPSEFIISDKQWRAVSALEKLPEVGLQVAIFINHFGAIENSLPSLFSKITGIDGSTSEHLLGVSTSFSQRLGIVETASLAVEMTEGFNAFYDELFSEIKFLEGRRNSYCHSLYTNTGHADQIRMICYKTDGRRATKEEIITALSVKKDCARAERVSLSLFYLLEGTRILSKPLRRKNQKNPPSKSAT
ncbi:hypothetical protein ACQW02_20900 [Humitalea sp. 24SJ18S-53]|uniref:hypothetical protein n=1 Tax=Humitalea sp. 24SJ18S-53 TaxID=3422307 RepID=UPI003D676E96